MKLKILRSSQLIYQNEDILEMNLDALSYSGIDYWSQEARTAKVKLLLDEELEEILLGSQREVRCGFHCFSAFIQDTENNVLYGGVLEEGNINIEYLSLNAKTVELELVDFLGLVLRLAEDRIYRIEDNITYLDPVATIPLIMNDVLHPPISGPEPETDTYTNADVRRLLGRIGPLNWQYAHLDYDYDLWMPYHLQEVEIMQIKDLMRGEYNSQFSRYNFGFTEQTDGVYFVYWQYTMLPGLNPEDYLQFLRHWTYRLNQTRLELVSQNDWEVRWPIPIRPEPIPPRLSKHVIAGEAEYRVRKWKLYYTGPTSIRSTEVVEGDYKAADLLGEMLRTANAVLAQDKYNFRIYNRNDTSMPVLHFTDPIEFSLDRADNDPPEITAVCLAFQDIIDSIQDKYKAVLNDFPNQATLRTHIKAEDIKKAGIASPYELIDFVVAFQNYRIRPLEISYDPITQEIEISGRAKHE